MTKKKKRVVTAAAILLAAALCAGAYAFCCTRAPGVVIVHPVYDPADPAEAADYADCIFVGRLERRRNVGSRLYAAHVTGERCEYPYTECTFTVLQVRKGALREGDEVRTYKAGGRTLLGKTWVISGDPTFAEGKTYLVYAVYTPTGVLAGREPMGMRELQFIGVFASLTGGCTFGAGGCAIRRGKMCLAAREMCLTARECYNSGGKPPASVSEQSPANAGEHSPANECEQSPASAGELQFIGHRA